VAVFMGGRARPESEIEALRLEVGGSRSSDPAQTWIRILKSSPIISRQQVQPPVPLTVYLAPRSKCIPLYVSRPS